MATTKTMMIGDVINVTEQLHADLLTAQAAKDPDIVRSSIIAAVEGLLGCVRTLASEIVKVELEGVETHLPSVDQRPGRTAAESTGTALSPCR